MRAIFAAMIAIALTGSASAEVAPPPVGTPAMTDVASPEAIVQATYAVLSGTADTPRDWARMRGLFVPGGVLMAASQPKDAPPHSRVMTVDEYIARNAPVMAKMGFFERGVTGEIRRFAHTATLDSPYESRHAPSDPAPFARGINHFQLFYDGTRWWVVSIYWEGETPAFPLPPEAAALLKAK